MYIQFTVCYILKSPFLHSYNRLTTKGSANNESNVQYVLAFSLAAHSLVAFVLQSLVFTILILLPDKILHFVMFPSGFTPETEGGRTVKLYSCSMLPHSYAPLT